MKSFVIGRVCEPLVTEKYCKFGCLNGRTSTEYTAWSTVKNNDGSVSDNPLFRKCAKLKDGDLVCVLVNTTITSNNTLGVYLQDVAPITDDLRNKLNSAFAVAHGSN